jgi:hypothetical protein
MKYREIEYTVVQGIERRHFKWGFTFETKPVTGRAETRAGAVAKAQQAIDLALRPKNPRFVLERKSGT